MNPETIIAAVTGIVMATVPEPYAGHLMTKLRDYFATLGQQSAEEAKTAAARENAAAAVAQVLPTIVDSPLSGDQPSAISDQPEVSRDAQRSEPPSNIQQPAPALPEPIPEPAPAAAPAPTPEPPKKNNGRNQAPIF
jgi:cell division septation protein DedD